MGLREPARDNESSHGRQRTRTDRRARCRRGAPVAGRPVRARGDRECDAVSIDPAAREAFPITSAGEDGVTRREFVRYLVLASAGFAAGNVGIALWSSLRSINEGSPRPIVELARVP